MGNLRFKEKFNDYDEKEVEIIIICLVLYIIKQYTKAFVNLGFSFLEIN